MKYTEIAIPGSSLHIAESEDFYAVICLRHDNRGPAIGGCRMLEYPSKLAAHQEAIRLARAMSDKAAAAELSHNGGKAVVIKPKGRFDRRQVLQQFAELVDRLQGRYITTVDSGTTPEDMAIVRQYTSYVTGFVDPAEPHYDPAPSTAYGVLQGMRATIQAQFGHQDLSKIHVAIQGLGNVGSRLARLLHAAGAKLTISDIDISLAEHHAKLLNAKLVSPELIHQVQCEIFAPCALGRLFNTLSISQLNCRIIAGAANDQLESPEIAEQITEFGITYVPDYLINAGGLIHLACLRQGKSFQAIEEEVRKIYQRVLKNVLMKIVHA